MIELNAPATATAFVPPVAANDPTAARFAALPLVGRLVRLAVDDTLVPDTENGMPLSFRYEQLDGHPYPEITMGLPPMVNRHGLIQLAVLTEPDARRKLIRLPIEPLLRRWAERETLPTFEIAVMMRNGKPVGVSVDIPTHALTCSIHRAYMLEFAKAEQAPVVDEAAMMGDYTTHWGGLLWHVAEPKETAGYYLRESLARWDKLCQARAKKKKGALGSGKLGIVLAQKNLRDSIMPLMVLWNINHFFKEVWPRVQTMFAAFALDLANPEETYRQMTAGQELTDEVAKAAEPTPTDEGATTPAEPPVAGPRVGKAAVEKPALPTLPAWLGDEDPSALLARLLAGGVFTCVIEGDPTVPAGYLPEPDEPTTTRGPRVPSADTRVLPKGIPPMVHVPLALSGLRAYDRLVNQPRLAARGILLELVGADGMKSVLPHRFSDILTLPKDRLDLVPQGVAGRLRKPSDRLCAIYLLTLSTDGVKAMLATFAQPTPLERKGRVWLKVLVDKVFVHLPLDMVKDQLLVCYPSGWLGLMDPPQMAAMGTPRDHTIASLCPAELLPDTYWDGVEDLATGVPTPPWQKPGRFDVMAFLRGRPPKAS